MQNMGGKTALGLDQNIGALLCYINICLPIGFVYSILVITQDKTNKLPRFHAFQLLFMALGSLVLFIPVGIVLGIIIAVMGAMSEGLAAIGSGLAALVFGGIGLAMAVFTIIAAIKAYGGEMYKIPVVGNFAEKYA